MAERDLKKGESQNAVVSWLDRNSLKQREFIEGKEAIRNSSDVYYRLGNFPNTDSAIVVGINNVEHSPLSYYSVVFVLFFDKQKKLLGFYIEKRAIGL